jgi:adenine specific DNA methylase Mod
MAKSQTLKTEVVQSEKDRIIFKLQQEYTPRVIHFSKPVNSLITLTLDDQGKIKYHKDMWNEKDYSHEGLGKVMKTLNGDQLTKVSTYSGGMKSVYTDVLCRLPSRRRLCRYAP